MKKKIKYLKIMIIALLFPVFSCWDMLSDTSHTLSLNEGLKGYYPFNGNTNDESGNGNNGTIYYYSDSTYTPVLVADRYGNADSAYSFSADFDSAETNATVDGGYIDTGIASFSGDYTVSAWTTFTTLGSTGYTIISMGTDGGGVNYYELNLYYEDESDEGFSTEFGYVTDKMIYNTYVSFSGTEWKHAAVVCKGSTMKTYVNGVLIGSAINPGPRPSTEYNPYSILIGDGPYGFYNGCIDDVRIYNRALSDSDIGDIYDIEKP